jgi:hypothetical protein
MEHVKKTVSFLWLSLSLMLFTSSTYTAKQQQQNRIQIAIKRGRLPYTICIHWDHTCVIGLLYVSPSIQSHTYKDKF